MAKKKYSRPSLQEGLGMSDKEINKFVAVKHVIDVDNGYKKFKK